MNTHELNWAINGLLLAAVLFLGVAVLCLASRPRAEKKKRKAPRDTYGLEGKGNAGANVGKNNSSNSVVNNIHLPASPDTERGSFAHLMDLQRTVDALMERLAAKDAIIANYQVQLLKQEEEKETWKNEYLNLRNDLDIMREELFERRLSVLELKAS